MPIRSAPLSLVLGICLGFAFISVSGLLSAPRVDPDVYLPGVAWLHRARFGIGVSTTLPLFLAACVLGLVSTARWWLVGTSVAISFEAFLIADAFNVPGAHNLLPFELVIYSPLVLAAFAGALFGRALSPHEDELKRARPGSGA